VTDFRSVAVFGGTGFLGRRIVRHLLDHSFAVRVISRHRQQNASGTGDQTSRIKSVRADVNDEESVAAAVAEAFAVVNAVSLYAERGDQTFASVHVEAAARVARHAQQSGARRLVHVSGIGADPASGSRYIASRGQGEVAVRREFPAAVIVRPAVMFGSDDAFLTPLMRLMRILPVFPMFGRGGTRLQPSWVEDVGEAIARVLNAPAPEGDYELAGPQIYTYESLLRTVGEYCGFRRVFLPVPFAWWQGLALVAERLPRPPVTRNQVELMEVDTVASRDCPGFRSLGITPRRIETVLAATRPSRSGA
jgi:uncharacterized protein YbjT (DUF2867 family)